MTVESNIENRVLHLLLNRPDRKNALTVAMYEQLVDSLEQARTNDDVRAVLISGAGDAFTSGNDLKDFMSKPPVGADSPVFRFLTMLVEFEKPLLAAVGGAAIGIGSTMLLHCDLVYASEKALFSFPFLKLALVPEAGSSLLLPNMLGQRNAADLLFFGDKFGADKAVRMGIVNDIVDHDQLVTHATERAETLAKLPPKALAETKRLMKQPRQEELKKQVVAEAAVFAGCLTSKETQEAFRAFFEKREPKFD